MINIETIEEFEQFRESNDASLIYISTPQCNVCKVLKPKLINYVNTEFPKIKMGFVNSEALPEATAQNGIFTVPTILVYLEGKELLRKSRNINLYEFGQDIKRAYNLFFT